MCLDHLKFKGKLKKKNMINKNSSLSIWYNLLLINI